MIIISRKLFPPTYEEFHSLGWGLMDGISYKKKPNENVKVVRNLSEDVRNEPHYYRLGYFMGNRGKWVLASGIGISIL